jgi:hypothetical protein
MISYRQYSENQVSYTIMRYLIIEKPEIPESYIEDFKSKNFEKETPINLEIHDSMFLLSPKLSDFFKTQNVQSVNFCSVHTYQSDNLDEFKFEYLYNFKNIYNLSVGNNPFLINPPLDLSQFPNLKQILTDSLKQFDNIDKAPLIFLEVRPFANDIYTDDFGKFRLPSSLKGLVVEAQKIKSLNGFENLINLEHLELSHMLSLKDISAISQMKNLKILTIISCPKVDYDSLPLIDTQIDFISIQSKVKSIKFLEKLPNLKAINISGVIEDGDISPLQGRKIEANYKLKKIKKT